jgi:hypothetical protein
MASRRHSSDTKWQTLGGNIISIQDNCVFMQIAILQCLAVVNTHTQIYRHYQSHHYFKKITHSCHHLPNNSRYFKKTTPLLWIKEVLVHMYIHTPCPSPFRHTIIVTRTIPGHKRTPGHKQFHASRYSQEFSPIFFLVLLTNRSRDLTLPGKHPLSVTNGK